MNDEKSFDPYRAPTSDAYATAINGAQLHYLYAFQFIFEHPRWFTNLLLVTLCTIIPVIGPIVFMGYQFELIEAWLARRDAPYPLFSFERFGDYLKRGIWPFLGALIFQLFLTPIIMVIIIPVACLLPVSEAIFEENGNQAAGAACALLGNLFIFAAAMLINLVAMMFYTPLTLAAGLSQELGPAFNFTYLKDFVSKLWRDMLLGYSFFFVAAIILTPLGLLACFFGIYLVAAWMWMAMTHFLYQFYAIYIARGGVAIPLKAVK